MATVGATARGDSTRRALLDAATVRFARDGYRATSVTDIARDADLGGTTAYVHYPNKEALFLAAVDADVGALFDQVLPAMTSVQPGPEWAGEFLQAVLRIVGEHPLAGRLLAGLEPSMTDRALATDAVGRLRARIGERLAAAQITGRIRPDVHPTELADGLVGLVIAATMATTQIGDSFIETFGRGLTALFQTALLPDPRLGHLDHQKPLKKRKPAR